MSAPFGESLQEDLDSFERKLKKLKMEYDQYFMGTRPRPPQQLRDEVQRIVTYWSSQTITNTALRFRFNSITARYFAFRNQWGLILRKIEAGTYAPHIFRAKLHEEQRGSAKPAAPAQKAGRGAEDGALFDAYLEARRACKQDIKGLTPTHFGNLMKEKATQVASKLGKRPEDVRFRVVVESGRVKLKASGKS